MAEIKVGDWVRLKPDQGSFEIEYDKLYKVKRIVNRPNGDLLYIHPTSTDYGLFASRFDLIRSAEEGFKVGDVINYLDSEKWQNVTINEVGLSYGNIMYGEGKNSVGSTGGFWFNEIDLVSVAEEKPVEPISVIQTSDGKLKMVFNDNGFCGFQIFDEGEKTGEQPEEKSHELTAKEAKAMSDDIIVSLDDIVSVYDWLVNNGFVIRKAV